MKTFTHIIGDPLGLHARPAGLLVKLAKTLDSDITLAKGDKSANATRLMALMNLGVTRGDVIRLTIEGGDEEASWEAVRSFLEKNL